MRVVLQRVKSASVSVHGNVSGAIGAGLLVFAAIHDNDSSQDIEYIADKIINMRIFADDNGRFDRSLREVDGSLLVVSQFTLYADTRSGRRPSFTGSAPSVIARPLFSDFISKLEGFNIIVETGKFGEMMEIQLVNDSRVTILVDSNDRHMPRHY